MPHTATGGSTSFGQEGRGRREGKAWLRIFNCVCPGKGKAGLGNSLELTSLSNVGSRVQGWSLVVWYLALGDVRQQKYWLNV